MSSRGWSCHPSARCARPRSRPAPVSPPPGGEPAVAPEEIPFPHHLGPTIRNCDRLLLHSLARRMLSDEAQRQVFYRSLWISAAASSILLLYKPLPVFSTLRLALSVTHPLKRKEIWRREASRSNGCSAEV